MHEKEVEKSTTYAECFRGINRLRTEAAVMVQIWQGITGITFIGYAVYFFELAGLPVDASFDMGVGNTAIGFVATCSSWVLMAFFGRRTIFMSGVGCMAVALILIGILDCVPSYDDNPGFSWAQAALLDVLTAVFQGSVGPLSFVIFAEVSATRLRSQTIALSAAGSNVFQIILTVAMPYILNDSEGSWRGKTGFFFGGISVLATIWCFFRLPETKGRTYEELDIMYEQRVPIWQFGKYRFDSEDGEHERA